MLAKRVPLAFQPVERGEAAGGRRVLAGAEGQAGVDLEIDALGTSGAIGRRVDVEAAGADRLQPGLAHRHPIGLAELLDPAARRRRGAQGRELLRRRLVVEIGVDQPVVGLGSVRLVGDEHRRIVGSR